MNPFLMLIAILVIVSILIIIIVTTQASTVNAVNDTLDDYIATDLVLSREAKKALSPLVFSRISDKPVEYAFSYRIEPSPKKRVLLITTSNQSSVMVNSEKVDEILEERMDGARVTYVGYVMPDTDALQVIVSSDTPRLPMLSISMD